MHDLGAVERADPDSVRVPDVGCCHGRGRRRAGYPARITTMIPPSRDGGRGVGLQNGNVARDGDLHHARLTQPTRGSTPMSEPAFEAETAMQCPREGATSTVRA